jgi:hypothetical protein
MQVLFKESGADLSGGGASVTATPNYSSSKSTIGTKQKSEYNASLVTNAQS